MAGVAGAPVPLVNCGEFIMYNDKTCQVIDIISNLGFNTYTLVDIDDGTRIKAYRHQLQKVNVVDLGLSLPMEFTDADHVNNTLLASSPQNIINSINKPPRFASVTSEALDQLSMERNSENTGQQTKWGVRIFQGIWFICLFVDGTTVSPFKCIQI